jgi:hypothetical protein
METNVENLHDELGREWLEHADMEVIQDGIDAHTYCGINMDMSEDELQHWGIKGMKWGVRRYQNADGSLTPAGRKRYNEEVEALKAQKAKLEERAKNKRAQERMQARTDKLRSEIDELKGKKKSEKSADDTPEVPKETGRKKRGFGKHDKPKKPEEMTPEELQAEITRMRNIQEYNRLYSQLHPQQVNKGKEVAGKFLNDAVLPAVIGSVKKTGEEYLNKIGKEALGLNVKSESEKLKKDLEKAKMKAELNDLNDETLQKYLRAGKIHKAKQEINKAKNGTSDGDELLEQLKDMYPGKSVDEIRRELGIS